MEKHIDEWLEIYYPEQLKELARVAVAKTYSRYEWCEQPETD